MTPAQFRAEQQEAEEYARTMIQNYGFSDARAIVVTEAARPHSPSSNLAGFWARVLTAIDKYRP